MGFAIINIPSGSSKHQQIRANDCIAFLFRATEATLLTGFLPVKLHFRCFEFALNPGLPGSLEEDSPRPRAAMPQPKKKKQI
jgi:hypothetical protein